MDKQIKIMIGIVILLIALILSILIFTPPEVWHTGFQMDCPNCTEVLL